MIVLSDWTATGTANELETDIGNDFKFLGPGLYLEKEAFMLIVFSESQINNFIPKVTWQNKGVPKDTIYELHYFSVGIHRTVFSTIPVTRVDNR